MWQVHLRSGDLLGLCALARHREQENEAKTTSSILLTVTHQAGIEPAAGKQLNGTFTFTSFMPVTHVTTILLMYSSFHNTESKL